MKKQKEIKKKNNRKYMIFGIVAFFALAFVTAGLVTYLSNEAQVTVTVESPMSFELSAADIDGNPSGWIIGDPAILPLDNIYGGESIHFFARDTNLANVDTIGDSSKVITCDTGVTCNDFISVYATTTSRINEELEDVAGQPNPSGPHDLIDMKLCTNLTATSIAFNYGAVGNPLVVGQSDTTEITATFKPNALGDYIFTLQKLA